MATAHSSAWMIVADAAPARAVERLERDQGGRRGDAGPGPVRVVAVAGDDAGDVRAVAPVVVAGGAAVDEVDELGDPLGGAAGVAQVVVVRRDARVDHRDADALAVEAHQGLDGPGADGNRLAADEGLDRAVEVDPLDVAAAGQLTEQPLGHPRRAAAHPRQPALGPVTLGANRLVGVAVVGELDDDRQVVVVALDVAQERVELGFVGPPRPMLPLRGRVVGESADGQADEQEWKSKRRGPGKVLVRPAPRAIARGFHAGRQGKAAARTVGAITRLVRSAESLRNSIDRSVPVARRFTACRRSLGQGDLARPDTAAARSGPPNSAKCTDSATVAERVCRGGQAAQNLHTKFGRYSQNLPFR